MDTIVAKCHHFFDDILGYAKVEEVIQQLHSDKAPEPKTDNIDELLKEIEEDLKQYE